MRFIFFLSRVLLWTLLLRLVLSILWREFQGQILSTTFAWSGSRTRTFTLRMFLVFPGLLWEQRSSKKFENWGWYRKKICGPFLWWLFSKQSWGELLCRPLLLLLTLTFVQGLVCFLFPDGGSLWTPLSLSLTRRLKLFPLVSLILTLLHKVLIGKYSFTLFSILSSLHSK